MLSMTRVTAPESRAPSTLVSQLRKTAARVSEGVSLGLEGPVGDEPAVVERFHCAPWHSFLQPDSHHPPLQPLCG